MLKEILSALGATEEQITKATAEDATLEDVQPIISTFKANIAEGAQADVEFLSGIRTEARAKEKAKNLSTWENNFVQTGLLTKEEQKGADGNPLSFKDQLELVNKKLKTQKAAATDDVQAKYDELHGQFETFKTKSAAELEEAKKSADARVNEFRVGSFISDFVNKQENLDGPAHLWAGELNRQLTSKFSSKVEEDGSVSFLTSEGTKPTIDGLTATPEALMTSILKESKAYRESNGSGGKPTPTSKGNPPKVEPDETWTEEDKKMLAELEAVDDRFYEN